MFIGFISIVGIVVMLIRGLISVTKKNDTAKKRFIGAGVWLVILIVALSMDSGKKSTPAPDTSVATTTDTSSTDTKQSAAPDPTPAPTTFKVGEAVPTGNLTFAVNSAKNAKVIGDNPYMQKKTDGTFLVINLAVKNNDNKARTVDTTLFKLKDASGKEYDPMADGDMYVNGDNTFFLNDVNPGLSRKGNIVFELPNGTSGLQLEVSSGVGWSGGESNIINLGK